MPENPVAQNVQDPNQLPMPIELGIEEVKSLITQYSSALAQRYGIPSVLIVYILQEIVYENKIGMMTSAIRDLEARSAPTTNIDLASDGFDEPFDDSDPTDISEE